jgi:hypothetical protein
LLMATKIEAERILNGMAEIHTEDLLVLESIIALY